MRFAIKKPDNTEGATWPAVMVGLFVAFGGVLFGYDTGTIGGILAMDFWQKTFATDGESITPAQDSLIVSILSAGTFFGALMAAPFADILGRRWGLFAASGAVFNLGVILQTVATTQPVFIAGRFFAGLGVGILSAIVPLYQSETLPKWIRGSVVGAYQLAITIVRPTIKTVFVAHGVYTFHRASFSQPLSTTPQAPETIRVLIAFPSQSSSPGPSLFALDYCSSRRLRDSSSGKTSTNKRCKLSVDSDVLIPSTLRSSRRSVRLKPTIDMR